MTTDVADVLYHAAFHSAYRSYCQIEDEPPNEADDLIYSRVNALQKTRCSSGDLKSSDAQFDMVFICNAEQNDFETLNDRLAIAKERLAKRGVIVFKGANCTNKKDPQGAWKCVARARCDENQFCCVLSDVDGGCAILQPSLSSRPYAKDFLPQYDSFEYLNANRDILLSLISWQDYRIIARFF